MPGGGYGLTMPGLDELKAGLKGSAGGLRDLRSAFGYMAETMERNVRKNLSLSVHYSGSAKDGAAHKALPKLSSTIESGATINGPWVKMEREDLFLHEFGGKSFWSRAGSGTLRSLNRRHESMLDAVARHGISGHVTYTKPRNETGNFIWNVGFRERTALGEQLHFGISTVCNKHGLPYEMPADPTLGIAKQTWSRAA